MLRSAKPARLATCRPISPPSCQRQGQQQEVAAALRGGVGEPLQAEGEHRRRRVLGDGHEQAGRGDPRIGAERGGAHQPERPERLPERGRHRLALTARRIVRRVRGVSDRLLAARRLRRSGSPGAGTSRRSGRPPPAARRAARLDDPPAVQHHDPVGAAHGREAVRDHDGGQAARQVEELVVEGGLGADVKLGGRLVQHQDAGARRRREQGARQPDPLPLAAGQLGAVR